MSQLRQSHTPPEFSAAAALFSHYEQLKARQRAVEVRAIARQRAADAAAAAKIASPVMSAPVPEPERIEGTTLPMPPGALLGPVWSWGRRSPPMRIIQQVAAWHGLTVEDLLGQARHGPIIAARHDAIGAVWINRPDLSMPQIGRLFGGRDHTTILNALRKRGLWTSKAATGSKDQ